MGGKTTRVSNQPGKACLTEEGGFRINVLDSTYHKLAGHQDDDAAVGGGLRIGLVGLVLDLLEREALRDWS